MKDGMLQKDIRNRTAMLIMAVEIGARSRYQRDGRIVPLPEPHYYYKNRDDAQLLTPWGLVILDDISWISECEDAHATRMNFAKNLLATLRPLPLDEKAIEALEGHYRGLQDNSPIDRQGGYRILEVVTGKALIYRICLDLLRQESFRKLAGGKLTPLIFRMPLAYGALLPGQLLYSENLVCMLRDQTPAFCRSLVFRHEQGERLPLLEAIYRAWQKTADEQFQDSLRVEYMAKQLSVFCRAGDNCDLCYNGNCRLEKEKTRDPEERWLKDAVEMKLGDELYDRAEELDREPDKNCPPEKYWQVPEEEEEDGCEEPEYDPWESSR